jgi:hypothetical protein
MTLELFWQINQVQQVLSVIILIMLTPFFRKLTIESKLIGLHYFIALIPGVIFMIFELRGKDGNIPQNIYMISNLFTLSAVILAALKGRHRQLFFTLGLLFLIFAVINIIVVQKNDINTYTKSLSSTLLIFYCLVYYYRLMVDLPVLELQRVPMFWYSIAILMYNAGTLFLLLFTTYLIEVLHNDLLIYWTFHNILDIVQNLIVMIGLWKELQNIRSRSLLPLAQS